MNVPIGVSLDLSTPTGMASIVSRVENGKLGNVTKHCII